MLTVPNGDLEIAYRETGSGDPVFFINGTGESSATFVGAIDHLAERYRCVGVDLRDTGGSSLARSPYTPRDLATDVRAVMEHTDAGPAHIVGFSLGGAVAQELAIAEPARVRSLVLLSTWARSDAWFVSQMRSWQSLRRAHAEDEHAFDVALEPWMFSPTTLADDAMMAALHSMWDDAPDQAAEAFSRQCDADIAHDALDRLRGITAPAVVVVGDDDICTPPRYAEQLAEVLPSARIV